MTVSAPSRWPDPHRFYQPDYRQLVAKEVRTLSDESCHLLEAVCLLHRYDEDWAEWSHPILRQIAQEIEPSDNPDPDPDPGPAPVPVQFEAQSFEDVFAHAWASADRQRRTALRTIAKALGVRVPVRRTKTKPAHSPATRPVRRRQPKIPRPTGEQTVADRRTGTATRPLIPGLPPARLMPLQSLLRETRGAS